VYPFDENGPSLHLYAMLKGIMEVCRSKSEEIAIELIVGVADPKYLSLDRHPLLNVPMVPVLRSLKSINGFKTTINGCSKLASKIKDANIIFHNSPPIDLISFTYPFFARLAGKKQIYLLHGSLINERVNSTARKYFHLIAQLGFFNKVIIPLESFKEIVAKLVCPYEIIVTIPTCVMTPWYESSDKIHLEGDPVLLFAGRLSQVKRADVLLEAFSLVTPQYPSARLYLAGSGPLEFSLKKLCAKLGISGKVVFLGHVKHRKLRVLYRSSDIFVLPSDAEFMSNSLLEAMASRCAVIASDIVAAEVIENGKNGLVFTHGDFRMLANNIAILAGDKTLRKNLSDAAYLTVKKKFDYRVVASKLIKEMRDTLLVESIKLT